MTVCFFFLCLCVFTKFVTFVSRGFSVTFFSRVLKFAFLVVICSSEGPFLCLWF